MADSTTEVRAQVIERGLMDPTEYDRWLSEKASRVAAALAECRPVEVTDQASYRSAKESRQELNRVISSVDAERKEAVAGLRRLMARVKDDTDDVLVEARSRSEALKDELDSWDEAQLAAKRATLAQEYEDMAPALVPLVGFDRVWEHVGEAQKWGNRSTPLPKCEEQLQEFVQRVAEDERTIDAFEMDDADRAELKAEYFRTLDLGQASQAVRQRIERRRHVEELERERREWASQEPKAEPKPEGRVLVFEVEVPPERVKEFVAAMRAIEGVHGRKVGER